MHNVVLAVRLICLSSNVTWLKSFTRYGHYAGEVEDIARLAIVSEVVVPKIRAFSCGLTV